VQGHLAAKPWVAWGYPGKESASDATAPSAPTGLVLSGITQTALTLSWAAATDAVGVTGYRLYRNGALVGTTNLLSYAHAGLTCGTSYTLAVEAFDAAGNTSTRPSVSGATAACAVTTAGTSTGLRVSGNKLVDGAGNVVTLRGVNRAGPEYACVQGWGIFEGPTDAASVRAIQSWHANVVHIGLNETCILGINGVSSAYSGSNYMNAVVAYVNLLHQHGIYAEVSLMWAAPGTQRATGHPPILNQDHSADALKAIATAFKNDPMTIIGLQSEPREISWACWRNGGSSCSVGYAALGMQAALDAVRSTGATNVVTVSGIDYANNLSQWLAYRPTDPTGQLMAEAHVYGGNVCSTTACFDREYAPVVSSVPVIFGEFGEHYDGSCDSTNTRAILDWADAHGVSYAAWTWNIWGGCLDLIASYDGTVKNTNYARFVRDRLLSHG
jgi:endoglucanase